MCYNHTEYLWNEGSGGKILLKGRRENPPKRQEKQEEKSS